MKPLNKNKARLLLLFTRDPIATITTTEIEYYTSDDERLIGFVGIDNLDLSYSALLFDRNSLKRYQAVCIDYDITTIEDARLSLQNMMAKYHPDNNALRKEGSPNDFFAIKVKPKQMHPYFKLLKDDAFYRPARKIIEELSYHHIDIDGNFVNQLQSFNGFDARIWELYLWCYFREEGFSFNTSHNAPDFVLNKLSETVAVEAVHLRRRQGFNQQPNPISTDEILEKLRNKIPVLFQRPLFDKIIHEYHGQKYWELPHVSGHPFVYAFADFHEDMSMTWTFPAIVSILYGIEQEIKIDKDGNNVLINSTGSKFEYDGNSISPLFFTEEYKHVSAVLFSSCGTLSKFNRLGVQAGYGVKGYHMLHHSICYNHLENATMPNVFLEMVDENSTETWANGVQIFHNPFADIPLPANLFPHAAHHYYIDDFLRSDVPENHIMSSMTLNLKGGVDLSGLKSVLRSKCTFASIKKQYNL